MTSEVLPNLTGVTALLRGSESGESGARGA